jgi:hypothetical protein
MKMIISFLILLSVNAAVFCQQDLAFDTRIIVQDTMGNTDTLQVGLATGITDGFNPQLGEISDMTPFDSILEVRGGIFLRYPSTDSLILTNRLISVAEEPAMYSGQTCYRLAERMFIFIHAIHQPVTIRWEKNEWANECTAASWITTEPLSETVTGWWAIQDEGTYRCMAQDSQVVWSLPYNLHDGSSMWKSAGWYTVHSIADGSVDTIPCIQIVPRYRLFFDTPCRISGLENMEEKLMPVTVLPNPTTDMIHIDTQEAIRQVWVYAGGMWQQLQGGGGLQKEIQVSHLPPGLYPLMAQMEDGSYGITRFVKM